MKKTIKSVKNILLFIIVIGGLFTILNFNYQKDVKSCIEGGHSAAWCKNELSK